MNAVKRRSGRSGSVLIVTLLMMVAMLIVVAMAVDLGYVQMAATEMQRSADAAAEAGAWKLLGTVSSGQAVDQTALAAVRATAGQFAGLNMVTQTAPDLAVEDAVIGSLVYPFNQTSFTFDTPSRFNAVSVHVRRTTAQNGEIGLFFARVMGVASCPLQTQATAAFCNNVKGFRFPSSGQNLGFLPFALDKETWDGLMAGGVTDDDYRWNLDTKQVSPGTDNIKEINLYPQGTGCPGNRGTVNIGASNNSTAHISSQIRNGLSEADLAFHGGELKLDANGHLYLSGDPGISAGVKDDLASIIGQPLILPIFDQVTGNGNNATYRIVGFVGVRILYVKLTGSMLQKRVVIQPAPVVTAGIIPSSSGTPSSYYVYSPAVLVK
jgi:hypothetical protein